MHGFGCEPASAATIAGLKKLLADGTVGQDEKIVCVLTGHALKDPDLTVNYHKEKQGPFSNPPVEVANNLEQIIRAMKT